MNGFLLRTALLGGFVFSLGTCKAGDYDLPACRETELCGNKIDDDCDGIKDNPELCNCAKAGESRSCPPRAGIVTKATNPASICTDEAQVCLSELQWSNCSGVDPIPEQCGNGLDDDCDGTVDANDPGGCAICVDGQTQLIATPGLNYRPESVCKIGIQECKNGNWNFRVGAEPAGPKPKDDTCDSFDDDCDGQINEDAVWRSGSMSFQLGQRCWDTAKQGACRSVGTVVCNAGATVCDNQQSGRTDYQRQPSATAFIDSTNLNAVWDWNCDGKVESVFCIGSNASCPQSNITKTIYMTIDHSIDCTSIKQSACAGSAIIRASAGIGTSIQCGASIRITECEAYLDLSGLNCRDKSSSQDGYMYCR